MQPPLPQISLAVFFLSVSPNEVVWLFGIDVEHVLPCRPDPLGGHCDEAEEEALHPSVASTPNMHLSGSETITGRCSLPWR